MYYAITFFISLSKVSSSRLLPVVYFLAIQLFFLSPIEILQESYKLQQFYLIYYILYYVFIYKLIYILEIAVILLF